MRVTARPPGVRRAPFAARHPIVAVLVALALGAGLLGPLSPLTPAAPASATPTSQVPWVTTGGGAQVNGIAVSSDGTQWLGGSFTGFQLGTGSGAVLDGSTGEVDRSFSVVTGGISAVLPDGSGGWYIGGAFTKVGTIPQKYLAHLDADGSLDRSWSPTLSAAVYALAMSADGSTLYVGGNFTTVNGIPRAYLATFDVASGGLTIWNPAIGAEVRALAVSGTTLYIGGGFTTVSGATRNRIAALDTTVNLSPLLPWNPNASSKVYALAVSGSTVYAGGQFTTIGGATRNHIAALDASGTATSWDPSTNGAVVYALAVSGSTVYAGGDFTTVNSPSVTRNHAAAFDASGTATAWDPNLNGVNVNALLVSGSSVYLGGDFTTVNSPAVARNRLAAVDATSGTATAWNPSASAAVNALAIAGSDVYAGGAFTTMGAVVTRNYLAAIDANGDLTSWSPNPSSFVSTMLVVGSTLYVGGSFMTFYGGTVTRIALAAFSTTTGALESWNANVNGSVYALAASGSTLYVGGSMNGVGGASRFALAAVSTSTGLATSWNPQPNYLVSSLLVVGSTLYVGGHFTTMNSGADTRNYAAAFDMANGGGLTAWNPDLNNDVKSLAASGSTVYIGGLFSTINNGTSRSWLAAVDATTGADLGWNPNPIYSVNALAISGTTLYAGGMFTTISGTARGQLAAFDTTTNTLTAWNPSVASGTLTAIAIQGSTLYAGGSFASVNAVPGAAGFAAVPLALPPVLMSVSWGTYGESGPVAGGSALTLTGDGFASGMTVTVGGAACTPVTVTNATTATCTLPPGSAGAVDVVVTTSAGSATLTGGFTYLAAPTITSLSPSYGSTAGGYTVTITGTELFRRMRVTVGGVQCASYLTTSPTSAQCVIPAGTIGSKDVVVTTNGGTVTKTNGFTYATTPTLTTVSPSSGPLAGGTTITLTGTSLLASMSVTVDGNTCGTVTVTSATSATCVTPPGTLGAKNIVVTTPLGTVTKTNGFTYMTTPTLTTVSPAGRGLTGSVLVTLTGTGFVVGTPVTVTIGGAACTSPNTTSTTQVTCTSTTSAAGAKDVTVTTGGGSATLTGGITYLAAPTLTGVSPASGSTAGGTLITLTGTSFFAGMSSTIAGVACTGMSVTSGTTATCTTPASGTAGAKQVNVTTAGGSASLAGGFTYVVLPTVTSVTPSSGPPGGGTSVTVTGTSFAAGLTISIGGVPCATSTYVSATSATCTTPAGSVGSHDVTVTTTSGTGTLANGFTYVGQPTISAVSPTSRALTGSVTITLTGTGFATGMTVAIGVAPCTGVTVTSATTATCASAASTAGAKDVTVTTIGGSVTLTGGLTYLAVPTLTSVSPTAGPVTGGTPITLTGNDFFAGMTATVGGAACVSVSVTSATTATCTTPAGAAGAVAVAVTTNGGTASLSAAFTYVASIAPTISAVSPSSGPAVGGTPMTLTGTGFAAGMSVTIGGAACASVSVASATTATCTTPPGSGAQDVVVTTSNGSATLVGGFAYGAQVTFGANGGSGTMPVQLSAGPAPLAPSTFAPPAGQTFIGWSTSAGGGGPTFAAGSMFGFTSDATLYAQWASTSAGDVVVFDANGGWGSLAWQQDSAAASLAPNSFTGNGTAVFAGWNTQPNGSGTSYADGDAFAFGSGGTAVMLFAQWVVPSSPDDESQPPPPSVVFGLLAVDGQCPAGWGGPSWAQWPNDGTGGQTCMLVIEWSSSKGTYASDPAAALGAAHAWEATMLGARATGGAGAPTGAAVGPAAATGVVVST